MLTGSHNPPTADAPGRLSTGRDIVCVSVMDWDWPFWTSRQHLMTQFARHNRVLFVDPPLTFASDYRGARQDPRLGRKLTRWARRGGLRTVHENLTVWSPPPSIPFNRVADSALFNRLLAFNQAVFRGGLRQAMVRLGITRPILWVSFNVYYGDAVAGRIGEALSVYHCTDEISGFPGYSPFIAAIEARLAARCDLVLATSAVLREAKARYNPACYFVPNAADVGLFSEAMSWSGGEPPDLRPLPRPRAGFIGQIEYRFNAVLVREVAERMPGWSFVLIGPVQEGHEDLEPLRRLPNVHFLGLKERSLLPAYLAGLDVALIPYKLNHLTRGIYPLKLHEYLAAGRPVVATPMPSLEELPDRVYLAADGPSFVAAIERATAEDGPARREQRAHLARRETWEARAMEISVIMDRCLQAKWSSVARRRSASSTAANGRAGGRASHERGPNVPDSGTAPVEEEPAEASHDRSGRDGLPWRSFLRLGRELSRRHKGLPKRFCYTVLGDLNLHRRVRSAHVLATLRTLPLAGADVLDAGCGEGVCSFSLAKELTTSHVLGIDIAAASIASCRAVANGWPSLNLAFEQADVTNLPYVERFEVAVCVDVLEHVEDDEAALRSLCQALKPGGRLVVHVPTRHQLQRRFLPTHNGHRVDDHVRDEYLPDELVQKMVRAGFEVERMRTTFGPAGELAFELNTLLADIPGLRNLIAALTYPSALVLGYLDVVRGAATGGNSLLVVGRKPLAAVAAGPEPQPPRTRGPA